MRTSESAEIDCGVAPIERTVLRAWIIALCAAMAMIDGWDTQTIGLVAPAIASDWHVAAGAFGPVFTSSLFSGMIGALTFGQAADRYGRSSILTVAILLFSLSSLATPLSGSMHLLLAVRLITGLGLGGALPVLIAVTSEAAPPALRLNIVSLMSCGFPLGAMTASLAAAHLIPKVGWSSVFYVGGAIPLAILPLVAILLPRLRSSAGDEHSKSHIRRSMPESGTGRLDAPHRAAVPVRQGSVSALFTHNRAAGTVLLWVALFLSLLLNAFLLNWMPLITHLAGLSMASAVLGVGALNFGGIVGTFVIGWVCKQMSSILPIVISYALGAVAVCTLGLTTHSGDLLLAVAFMAGLLTIGSQMCTVGVSASFYESDLRATGVGWAFGLGRIGAVVGPLIGGVLVSYGISTAALFLASGLVALGSAFAIFGLGRTAKRHFPNQIFTARIRE